MKKRSVKETLYNALADAQKPIKSKSVVDDLIDFVLDNTHLTYKYILFTALAAKATFPEVNPLALQAKSSLKGAYDARSICHGVIVGFEMTELGKALGGSNEPFLNKPARFPELSKTNAVRRGRDQEILYALCDKLPRLQTAEQAYAGLVYATKKLLVIKKKKESLTDFSIQLTNSNAARLYRFLDYILLANYEGEILTLAVSGLYELFMKETSTNYLVEVHPVNQSGASSKEVSDLDVYRGDSLYICNELKHKPFTDNDLRHAADKVIAASQSQMHFIVGRDVYINERLIVPCVREYLDKGFFINVVPVMYFVKTLLGLIKNIDVEYYLKYILQVAVDTKFKEETISFIRESAHECFGV